MRPVVAITSEIERPPGEAFLVRKQYVRAVEVAGAMPFIVAPGCAPRT